MYGLNGNYDFLLGKFVMLDTSAILSNKDLIKYICSDSFDWKFTPVITSGVYNEVMSLAKEKNNRGALKHTRDNASKVAKEIFPLLEKFHRKNFYFWKSHVTPSPISEKIGDVDHNQLQISAENLRRYPMVLFSNDKALLEEAHKKGVPTWHAITNET